MKIINYSIIVYLQIMVCVAMAQGGNNKSMWDETLPDLKLDSVSISGSSLQDAWENMSRNLMIQSVIVIPDDENFQVPFSFKKEHCTVKDIFNEFTSRFPRMAWTQDQESGVIWFHPKEIPYNEILSYTIDFQQDEFGLRMVTDVLDKLPSVLPIQFWLSKRGMLFLNTFDYTVDFPKGKYTLRKIINQCCISKPSVSFILFRKSADGWTIAPLNLLSQEGKTVPPGAMHWWRTELNPSQTDPPSDQQVIKELSSHDPKRRWAARQYLVSNCMILPFWEWMDKIPDREAALWTTLAVLDTMVQDPIRASNPRAIARIRKEFDDDLLMKGDSQLALFGAAELARVGKDRKPLEKLMQRPLSEAELNVNRGHLSRIVRESEIVRSVLKEQNSTWPNFSRSNILQLETGLAKPVFQKEQ